MKKAFLILGILFTAAVNAQQINSGIATYQTKTTLDMSNWGGRGEQMSEQQKKQIAERMRSRLEKTFTLSFNKEASVYEEVEKLDTPGNGGGGGGGRWGSFSQGAIYKNIAKDLYLRENDLMGKIFLVKDSLPKLDWKLEKESKMIGQYAAFKATATQKDNDLFQMIRRRRDAENTDNASTKDSTSTANVDEPKEQITVWYTPQIPVAQGPDEYSGLPGLILEVNAGRTTILCTKIVLNPKDGVDIKEPSKGKEVTRAGYNQIMEEKTKEMAERFRGRGFGGGRGRQTP